MVCRIKGLLEGGHEMRWEAIGCVVVWRKVRRGWKMEFYQVNWTRVFLVEFTFDATEINRCRTKIYVEVSPWELLSQLQEGRYVTMSQPWKHYNADSSAVSHIHIHIHERGESYNIVGIPVPQNFLIRKLWTKLYA